MKILCGLQLPRYVVSAILPLNFILLKNMSDNDKKFLGGIFDAILSNIYFLSKEQKEKILKDNHFFYEKAQKKMEQIAEERFREIWHSSDIWEQRYQIET